MSMHAPGQLDRDFVTIYFLQGSPEKHKIAIRRIYLILGVIVFLFVIVFARVWQEMRIMKLGYELNRDKLEYRRLMDEERSLLSRRNALANLERVEAIAKTELGLKAPQSSQLVFLTDPEESARPFPGWFGWVKKIQGSLFKVQSIKTP
jgi:cell division protein FtsL